MSSRNLITNQLPSEEEEQEDSSEEEERFLGLGEAKLWTPEHGPRQVFFSIDVVSLRDIDEVKQRFAATLRIKFQWMLSESEEAKWREGQVPFEPEWLPPQVRVENALELTVTRGRAQLGRLSRMMQVRMEDTVEGVFQEQLELQNFPFDRQEFKLVMTFPESHETFQMHPSEDVGAFVQMAPVVADYSFLNPVVELGHRKSTELLPNFSTKVVRWPTLVLRARGVRTWQSYAWKIVLTLALVSLAALAAFAIPAEDLANRLSHVTTLFLTSVATQIVVASGLPKVEYLTLMDQYIIALNIFFFLLIVVMGAEIRFAIDLGSTSEVLALCVWAVLHLWLLARAAAAKCWGQWQGDGEADAAPLQASARFEMLSGDKSSDVRKFFGNRADYLASSNAKQDCTQWTGTWYSEDFYGPHGREYVSISVVDKNGAMQLVARKITGDAYVPCGQVSWRTTAGLPSEGGEAVPYEVQYRMDKSDPKGFEWGLRSNLRAVSLDCIQMRVGSAMEATFHRHSGKGSS